MIEEPGIYCIPNDEYHADPCIAPSLSSGIAKLLISRSPLHAMMAHPRLNPDFEPQEQTRFDNGSVAHALLLEGDESVVAVNADDWRTKAAQSARDEIRAGGKTPILTRQLDRIMLMVEAARTALKDNKDLQIDLATGKAEESFIWNDDGAWCRARPDWHNPDLELILDYKTTAASANPSGMSRLAYSMGWDIQAGHYLRGYRKLVPCRKGPRFVFMVQEVEPPFAVSFVGMGGTFLALGEDKVDHAIREWRKCIKAKLWPAYGDKIIYPDPPSYAVMEWEENSACRP